MKPDTTNICIKIERRDLDYLKRVAKELRVPYSVLARSWIVQTMKEQGQSLGIAEVKQ